MGSFLSPCCAGIEWKQCNVRAGIFSEPAHMQGGAANRGDLQYGQFGVVVMEQLEEGEELF